MPELTPAAYALTFVAALAAATLGAMGGLSGAVLLLPWQIGVLGITGPENTPTNHLYNTIATPWGVWGHAKGGRLIAPLVAITAAGTLPGVLAGTWVRVNLLADPARFRVFVGAVLISVSLTLVRRLTAPAAPAAVGRVVVTHVDRRRLAFRYAGVDHTVSVPALWALTLGVGLVGGVYGMGGGALIAPLLVGVFGLPVHAVAGASLFGTFLTSTLAVITFVVAHQTGAPTALPRFDVGLTMGAAGLVGTRLGAALQPRVPARLIEAGLAAATLGAGLNGLLR